MSGIGFTPINKQQKKTQKDYFSKQRGSWMGVNPVSRVIPSKKIYNRKKKYDSYEET